MKLIGKGLLNKIINVDDSTIEYSDEPLDGMNLAFKTKNSPYLINSPAAKNPLNDPNLFIVYFQRIL